MAEVLYRKYRSRRFADVQGQEAILAVLTNSLQKGNFAHAYLLAGPRGTGKTSVARLVAKALNCENFEKKGDVCNECEACLAVEAGSHIDIVEVDAASNRGIEEIRQIRDTINFLPNVGKFKVYIIDEAHMLTREAFNALLKTLEEPPAHVVFIMATTEPHKVPVTILSRVQRLDFKLATPEQLKAKLAHILEAEERKADPEVLDLLYKYSEGSYRDAESILGKIIASREDKSKISIEDVSKLLGVPSAVLVTEIIEDLAAGDADSALTKVHEAVEEGNDIAHLVKSIIATLRVQVVELVKAGKPYERQLQILHTLMGLQSEMRFNNDMRLLLEIAVLKLSQTVAPKNKVVAAQADIPVAKLVTDLPAKAVKAESKLPTKPAAKSDNLDSEPESNPEEQWVKLLAQARKANFQLWTVLKTCQPSLKDNILTLETGYKSNITVLENPDSISKLRPLLDMVYSSNTALEFALSNYAANQANAAEGFIADPSNASLVEEIF
jgi:DNA polymerase III subunit gamma/tau